jgi:RimJ/RimL family protein N-acetyltransferase
MTEAKRRFCEEMDILLYRAAGRTVGVCTAHPTDWSTYYIRTLSLLPEYRERRFLTDFETHMTPALKRAGAARYEAECSVANTPMIRFFVGAGFIVSATVNSERWGTMLRFTKFLNDDAEAAFKCHFVHVPAFGRDPGSP